MAISKTDMYLGSAILRIAGATTFTEVNRISRDRDLYRVTDAEVLFRVATRDGKSWRFALTRDELDPEGLRTRFVAFVCGASGVVALACDEILSGVRRNARNIEVGISHLGRGRFSLSVAGKPLPRDVHDSEFPNCLFGITSEVQDRESCWPPLAEISLYDNAGRRYTRTHDRLLDLADNLGGMDLPVGYVGVSTIAPDWLVWDESRLQEVEQHIRDDLEFDGFEVSISRESEPADPDRPGSGVPCSEEFRWRVEVLD